MPLHYVRRLGALGLLLTAASCAPTYLLGVHPTQPHNALVASENYAEATADSVSMALRFVAYEADWLVFEAEYHNDSHRPVTIDPAAFAQVPTRQVDAAPAAQRVRRGEWVPAAVAAASQHLPLPTLPAAPLPALDPPPGAESLQRHADAEAAKASRPDWLGLALVAVSLGVDIAGSVRSHETYAQYQTRALLHDATWAYTAISSANHLRHAATAEELAWHAAHLRDFGLRQGPLLPSQQVRGYVYLPRFDAADSLRVLAPLGRGQAALSFVQEHQRR